MNRLDVYIVFGINSDGTEVGTELMVLESFSTKEEAEQYKESIKNNYTATHVSLLKVGL